MSSLFFQAPPSNSHPKSLSPALRFPSPISFSLAFVFFLFLDVPLKNLSQSVSSPPSLYQLYCSPSIPLSTIQKESPSQLPPWQDGHLICHTSHAARAWKPSLTPPKNEVLSSSSRDDMKYLFVLLIKTKIIKRGKRDLGGVCFLTE